MPSCERCWSDSRHADDSQAEYQRLLDERDCTPEQQAGPDAAVCPTCDRSTVHQYAHVCMVCGFRLVVPLGVEAGT